MTPYPRRLLRAALAAALLALAMPALHPSAQGRQATQTQKVDEAYTALIKQHTQDPRITTELVDHLPASDTVPSPLKFHGRIVGTPDELTYAKDIHRYFDALDKASDRVSAWSIGTSEEGRDIYVLAVSDAATIKQLEKYKGMLHQLSDPRTTTEEQARALFRTAKPIYWLTSGIHSSENGGPEMLMELAYRLAVQETPFIQQIRDNVITFITPVIEPDGREKQVDTYYFNRNRPQGEARLPLMYWGKYVAHDNNRDGMGQILELTRAVTSTFLEWRPTVLHDLHEQATYLYASTGTGPYNEAVDAITVDEWWLIAKTEVMEMTKRGVPGVWTYGFYDGWTPNYMFFIANARNAIGRFYEVMGYGPQNRTVSAGATTTSREWFRPNPPLPTIQWGPRNNTNIQQSGVLIALNHFAKNREMYLENYWIKNRNAVERGKNGPIHGWVLPADQKRKSDAAVAVNDLRRQGLEIHRANAAFKAGTVEVKAGDYIVRGDQPYRTIADMYFSVQSFAPQNPRPYDDTGWTFQYMRNLTLREITDKSLLSQPMTPITADIAAPGGIEGTGPVVVINHTADNNLVTFRFRHKDVRMLAAQEDFEAAGRRFRAGSFIIPDASAAALDPTLKALGIAGVAMASAPKVPTHELDVPRIGFVHAWQRTQDEGWVRLALDNYEVPYTYFADTKLREGNLRQRYDVIIYPTVGGSPEAMVAGIPMTGTLPLPYKRTDETPNLGAQDEADDIRGGMGWEGLMELVKFVREGGTLITEGGSSALFPDYRITPGINLESPSGLFVRGSVMRGIVADRRSPIAYGFDAQVPVLFGRDTPIMSVGGVGGFGGGGRGAGVEGVGQNITPMAAAGQVPISAWDPDAVAAAPAPGAAAPPAAQGGRGGRGGGGRGGFGFGGGAAATGPRVIVQFPSDPADMLLSGTLAGGEVLANRAQVIDAPLGDGHVVMFAIRPFWRWQTQGTFSMGFNAILNWNDLKAGRPGAGPRTTDQ